MPSAYSYEYGDKEDKAGAVRADISGLMAGLAGQPRTTENQRKLTGPERAAVLMLALGQKYGSKVISLLDDDELRKISIAMSRLGTVPAFEVENLLLEVVSKMGGVLGDYDAAERVLRSCLPAERISGILDQIRGPAGRNIWEKIANVPEEMLANYLKNEYPQTVAVVLSKLRPEIAARMLVILPEALALDVTNRMLKMGTVQKDVIEHIEQTLRTEFISNLSKTRQRDAHDLVAGIFNNFDQQTETRFLTELEKEDAVAAERIKALMFTFDDLVKLDTKSMQTLMRNIDKDKLVIALKGASKSVCQFFLSNMSKRAAKMLVDDMQAAGPVRMRDVAEARALLVKLAKDLAAKGEIQIVKSGSDDELID